PQLPTFSEFLPADETAQLLGVDGDRIRRDLPLAAFNSGITNGLVPLVDEDELVRLQPNFCSMKSYFAEHGLDDLELYCVREEQTTESGHLNIRSRNVFWYGVQEEAATGTASLSLAAALFERFGGSDLQISVTQGLLRQGTIIARIVTGAESTAIAWLEGCVNLIASGTDLVVPA
ncbi:PhzF family phenazine biosynthesis protein, partial [Candidatus Bathyarchaeota archaeon]|nr:PhzF family phenazine biosynthesis protein [Candidatus Bathyarchaeota archaeon]